jgi:ribonuclease D
MDYTLIETDEGIINLRKYLHDENITKIAMDFECEFKRHSYSEKLCLIQIFDGKKFFIIDPFKISNDKIIKFFINKQTIKIMYGAESDISLIYSQYGIFIRNVFDQKIIVDIFKLDYNGLNDALKHYLCIEIKDKKKHQLYNWTNRPLDENAIQYALNDVAYLLKLNDKLMEQVKNSNKYEELIYKLIKKNHLPKNKKIQTIFKKKEFKELSDEDKEIFKNIYEIREIYAKEYDMPPFHIINNDILFNIVNKTKNINEIKISKKIPIKKQIEIKENIKNKLVLNAPNFA